MDRIFISYRRHGTDGAVAGRLNERLQRKFGKDRIFFDINSISGGSDFHADLDEALVNCAAFVAVIGPSWWKQISRLQSESDFIRLELEAALRRTDIPIIPLLVMDVQMPGPKDLPTVLEGFCRRSAIEISHEQFDQVVDGSLTDSIKSKGRFNHLDDDSSDGGFIAKTIVWLKNRWLFWTFFVFFPVLLYLLNSTFGQLVGDDGDYADVRGEVFIGFAFVYWTTYALASLLKAYVAKPIIKLVKGKI